MPFELKNAPLEFQNIMNKVFNAYSAFSIVYIDDVLIFSNTIDSHFKHLSMFQKTVKHAGLAVSAKKMNLCKTEMRFLGHNIKNGTIIPISRAIEFASKFLDEIKDKNQLQRFLGSLNYIADFYKNLAQDAKPLFERLKKNPPEWSEQHTQSVKLIKIRAKQLPCLALANPE